MLRLVACLAGLVGAAGVALAALSTHAYAGTSLNVAASMLSLHAPALLALAFGRGSGMLAPRLADLAAIALLVGLLFFSGDLACRAFIGSTLFPMAAPIGGVLLIGGWLLIALSGLVGRPDRS